MVPPFMPTRPPNIPPGPPATLPDAWELSIVPVFKPASPPMVVSGPPVTPPLALDPLIEPALLPASPPMTKVEPLTAPLADELTIEPSVSLRPTSPPRKRALGTLSAAADCEPVIVPEFSPTSPPTVLNVPLPTVTLPVEVLFAMVAPASFRPTRPPAVTKSPVTVTALATLRFDRLPLLWPIRPPMFAKPPVLTVCAADTETFDSVPFAVLSPTNPPIHANVMAVPVPLTLPEALDPLIDPSFR